MLRMATWASEYVCMPVVCECAFECECECECGCGCECECKCECECECACAREFSTEFIISIRIPSSP